MQIDSEFLDVRGRQDDETRHGHDCNRLIRIDPVSTPSRDA
jgi:hypothetical protein